jgi:PRA1 family protein
MVMMPEPGGSAAAASAGAATAATATALPTIDIEGLRLHISSWVANAKSKISLETIRPLPVFLGIRDDGLSGSLRLSSSAFTKVHQLHTIPSRIADNCDFFLSNYVLVAMTVAVVVSLMHLEMIVLLAALYGLWLAHSYLISHSLVVFGIGVNSLLTVQQRFYLLFAISTLAIVWACMVPAMIWTGISSVLILSHAILRNPNHRSMDVSQRDGGVGDNDHDNNMETAPLVAKV